MSSDQDISAGLNGVTQDQNGNPTNQALPWRWVRVRARQIPSALAKLIPFAYPNPQQPASVSAFDAIEGTAEQVASRHIDPYGNVVNFFTVWVVQWYWFLDGCPTPLSQERLHDYLTLANQLNAWPSNYPGISASTFPGEQYTTYPAWPASPVVPLDSFLPGN